MRHPHQQVFSTGGWWDFAEIEPGLYRRTHEDTPDYWDRRERDRHMGRGEVHNFSAADGEPHVCEKCGIRFQDAKLHGIRTDDGLFVGPAPEIDPRELEPLPELPTNTGLATLVEGHEPGLGAPSPWSRSHEDLTRMAAAKQDMARKMDAHLEAEAPHITPPPPYDPSEQDVLMEIFTHMLRFSTRDGGRKRRAGEKPPWWRDTHEKQIFSHLAKWKRGERVDPDSGAHPLVHLAWRALAIAWNETMGAEAEPRICVLCGRWLGFGIIVGAGDGKMTGRGAFAHDECYAGRERK